MGAMDNQALEPEEQEAKEVVRRQERSMVAGDKPSLSPHPPSCQGGRLQILGVPDPVESYEDAVQAWHHLDGLRDDLNWTYGALVSLVAVKYGEGTLEKYGREVGRTASALRLYRQVFEQFENTTRVAFPLRWNYYRVALSAPEPDRVKLLDLASKNAWRSRDLERHIRTAYPRAKLLPEGKFRVIYADPPWEYPRDQHSRGEQETTLGSHYQSLSYDELAMMAVKDIAADDAVLFLWATSPKLEEALDLAAAWGFDYKASMVWDKVKHNVGYYVSVRHELLLICTRGSCTPDVPELVDSVVVIERSEHSKKPSQFRSLIDRLYPHGPRIELFAREKADGWEAYGNDPRVAVD